MRRARKAGRWVSAAPIGYANMKEVNNDTRDERKYIAPREPAASIMKWVFEELSKGVFAIDQVRKEANKKG